MANLYPLLTSLIFIASWLIVPGAATPEIDPTLLQAPTAAFPTNIFITMRNGTDRVLAAANSNSAATVDDRRTGLYTALRAHAGETQAALLAALKAHSTRSGAAVNLTSFWITNQVYVRGADASLLDLLRNREDVARIDLEQTVRLDPVLDLEVSTGAEDDDLAPIPFDVAYNLDIIRVPEVWANDVNGSDIVVANIDTGVRATHVALRGSYKNDEYSWFDPVTGSKDPFDDHTHGTMTMGLIAGGLEVGVAFGAKWIACKGLNSQGQGHQSALLSCGQFILCPTTPDGTEPDCSQAPHVVSNSWNSADSLATWFDSVINTWRAAGIVPVWSAGNFGENGCASMGSQAPRSTVIAVGSTNPEDRLSWFSSLGPSPFDANDIKPDLTAPGEGIRTAHSQSDTTYALGSGTSFAAPHVAGVIALLLSIDPELEYTDVKRVLETTATRDLGFTGAACSGQLDSVFPNFHFGHGRLDALGMYECAMEDYKCLEEPPTTTTSTTTTTRTTTTTTEPTTTTITPTPTTPTTPSTTTTITITTTAPPEPPTSTPTKGPDLEPTSEEPSTTPSGAGIRRSPVLHLLALGVVALVAGAGW